MRSVYKTILCVILCAGFAPTPAADAATAPLRRIRDGAVEYILPAGVPRSDADEVMPHVRAALRALRADFPEAARAPLRVSLTARTGDFTVWTGQPWWHGGVYRDGEITLQPVETLRKRGALSATVRHETAHHALDAAAGGRTPLWLAEGFSSVFSGELRPTRREARRWLQGARSIIAIEAGLKQIKDIHRAEAAYRAAFAFVSAIEAKYGHERLARAIREIGAGRKPDEVFSKIYGAPPERMLRKLADGSAGILPAK